MMSRFLGDKMSQQNFNITQFTNDFSEEIWDTTYRYHSDETVDDTFYRVAKGIAAAETTPEQREYWTERFFEHLQNFRSTTGGRIYSNAGTDYEKTTLFNCYVGPTETFDIDSLDGILTHLRSQSQTLKSEGGWGENFSYIRPRGSKIAGIGATTPGAVKYMELFDRASDVITSGSGVVSADKTVKKKIRKGAMMGVIDVTHPDVIEFITAKQTAGRLSKFNISVNCTNDFMDRVNLIASIKAEMANSRLSPTENNVATLEAKLNIAEQWNLEFPDTTHEAYAAEWDGILSNWKMKGYPVIVHNVVTVSYLWDLIMQSTYNRAEPGVLFLDRANELAPSNYHETIKATNPSMPAGTLVGTKNGIYPIDSLEGQEFQVKSMDGTWADAKCFLSSESEPLINIHFSGSRSVSSTKEHRWPVLDQRNNRIYKVYASELREGDLIPMNLPAMPNMSDDGTLTRDHGFLLGYMLGDGWLSKRSDGTGYVAGIVFAEHEKAEGEKIVEILNSLKPNASSLTQKVDSPEYYIQFTDTTFIEDFLIEKCGFPLSADGKRIPTIIWQSNDEVIAGFVDGLISADGHISNSNESHPKVTLTTASNKLAYDFSKLMGFCGISALVRMSEAKASFPNGIDYDKTYVRYDVTMRSVQLQRFSNMFELTNQKKETRLREANNLEISLNRRNNIDNDYNRVMAITKSDEGVPVWDVSVYHDQHVFPTEYGYTGNCGEQMLPSAGICCLSSLNLTQFVNSTNTGFDIAALREATDTLVRFLDNVNTEAKTPLPEYDYSRDNKRRIGIGVLGWGSALYMLKIRFGSDKAEEIKTEFMHAIAQQAYMSSIDLAVERGMYKYCDPIKHSESVFVQRLGLSDEYMAKLRDTGIRNSSLLSVQPTGNTGIFANMASGGLEPVFMPSYVRTSIVNGMPDSIADVCPKWFEGEFHETEMFKFAKEGDETILKGTGPDGTVYKIDVNRGLTKETLCEDYGVHVLRERGEWDENADWAVTTTTLTVDDHLRDMKGFAFWIDSSMSKTINLPEDYSFDDFKRVYVEGYNSGVLKGLTTYRSGSFTSVLSAVEEKDASPDQEEIILDDVKLPESSTAEVKILRAESKKLYCTVSMLPDSNRPFALFVKSNYSETSLVADEAVDLLLDLAITKGIPQNHIDDQTRKMSKDNNINKVARLISLNLRHGVFIKNIVATLDKSENAIAGSFTFAIKKLLMAYVNDGEVVEDAVCEECGSTDVRYESGCSMCASCGSSRCG